MDIFINTDKSPAQLQAKSTGSPLSSFKVNRGAVVPLSVTILDSSSASGLRMGIKAKGNYEGDLLILAEADSGTQTEQGTRFDLKLVASSLALNDALDVGEGKESTPATLAAMTEFAWMEGGDPRLSDTLQTTIINDIIRLATDAPEAATGEHPAPDLVATKSWVNSKQASTEDSGFVMQPRTELAVIGIAAAIVLYCDLRSFIAEQAEAQEKTIRVLSEMSVCLQTIEYRMEVYHMQPPPVTKKDE